MLCMLLEILVLVANALLCAHSSDVPNLPKCVSTSLTASLIYNACRQREADACQAGLYQADNCSLSQATCLPCPEGTFTPNWNNCSKCFTCKVCPRGVEEPCSADSDTACKDITSTETRPSTRDTKVTIATPAIPAKRPAVVEQTTKSAKPPKNATPPKSATPPKNATAPKSAMPPKNATPPNSPTGNAPDSDSETPEEPHSSGHDRDQSNDWNITICLLVIFILVAVVAFLSVGLVVLWRKLSAAERKIKDCAGRKDKDCEQRPGNKYVAIEMEGDGNPGDGDAIARAEPEHIAGAIGPVGGNELPQLEEGEEGAFPENGHPRSSVPKNNTGTVNGSRMGTSILNRHQTSDGSGTGPGFASGATRGQTSTPDKHTRSSNPPRPAHRNGGVLGRESGKTEKIPNGRASCNAPQDELGEGDQLLQESVL